ncbi:MULTISPECIES: cellulose synthase operon protein YhjQ/BcsQ [Asaia]|uniref:cellulose synthase operon protein YhjQ/BcsQ n=1 Tax=Asaia TaxID=91914 RepID=UPI000EFDB133|nr:MULTISPECIES: cellulose synthase operon protein YhjQ/BcsQ [Asaia]NIE81382.1 AAA family ATPase [Asaia sp. As-1742]
MTLICVASPKGGVGKTMVTAHLADEIRRAGMSQVVAIDLDPQNALRLHFGVPMSHRFGLSSCIATGRSWGEARLLTSNDIQLYPFGSQPLQAQANFEHAIRLRPDLIAAEIEQLSEREDTVVIVDTSPGYSTAFASILPLADMVVSVMTAEASCISLLPDIHSASCYGIPPADNAHFVHRVVVNRFDPLNRVGSMAMPQIVRRLGPMHLGTICRDEHVGEAFASQRLIQHYAPYSRAAADLELIGTRLLQTINSLH